MVNKLTQERPNRHGRRRQTFPVGESRTKQADAHETDVNVIMGRYIQNGDPSIFMRNAGGIFADISNIGDYQTCLTVVNEARDAFAELSAPIRERFGNNPTNLLAAVFDPARKAELEELGIFTKPEPPAPAKIGAGPAEKTETTSPPATTADSATKRS